MTDGLVVLVGWIELLAMVVALLVVVLRPHRPGGRRAHTVSGSAGEGRSDGSDRG